MDRVPDSSAEDADLEAESAVIAVAHVVRLQSPQEMWKIASTEFAVFYTHTQRVAEMAQRARDEGRLLHVESVPDASGKRVVRSLSVSDQVPPPANAELKDVESPREGFLF